MAPRPTKRRRRRWSRTAFVICCSIVVLVSLGQYSFHPAGRRKTVLRALVSYVHFESSSQAPCEVLNKRTNLAFFIHEAVLHAPHNIQFVFSFPDKVPSAHSLLASLGIPTQSKTAQLFHKVLSGQLENVQTRKSSIVAPDLCHHRSALIDKLSNYDYFVILNDGVRGPFLSEGQRKVRSEPHKNFHKNFLSHTE